MKWFSGFLRLWKELITPCEQLPTGLEEMDINEFLIHCEQKGAFRHSFSEVLQTASWSDLMDYEFLVDRKRSEFIHALRSATANRDLLELGVGDRSKEHEAVSRDILQACSYQGVDRREVVSENDVILEDVLRFLSRQPDASANIMAFGFLNEPIDPLHGFSLTARSPKRASSSHCEFEYVRRLAKELFRIVPPGGVLFGDGLHALGSRLYFEELLISEGFVPRSDLIKALARSLDCESLSRIWIRDPFFFVRPANPLAGTSSTKPPGASAPN